jgi:hypothetical protein
VVIVEEIETAVAEAVIAREMIAAGDDNQNALSGRVLREDPPFFFLIHLTLNFRWENTQFQILIRIGECYKNSIGFIANTHRNTG